MSSTGWSFGPSRLRVVLMALLIALIACAWPPVNESSTDQPSDVPVVSSPIPGRIAFLDAAGNVRTIRPDGSHQTALTEDAGPQSESEEIRRYETIAWSQVSWDLAMVQRIENPTAGLQEQILLADAESGGVRTVFSRTGSSPFYLYWAPHDRALTFLASRSGQTDLDLWLWTEDGSQRLDHGQPYYWAWSPRGDSIATHVGGEGQSGRVGRLAGPGQARAALPITPGLFQAPVYSPDGEQLIVSSGTGPAGRLALLELDGAAQYLASVDRAVAFDWSPTGEAVAFVEQQSADINGFGELMLLDMGDGAENHPRGTGVAPVVAFFWSPTGENIAALTLAVPPGGGAEQVNRRAQPSEPHLRIVVLETASGESRVAAEFVPTSEFLTILPFYDQYQRSSTIWSPDGRALVFTGRRSDGQGGLFVLDIDDAGSLPHLIGRGELAFWSFVR